MADEDKNKTEGKKIEIRGGRGHIVGDFNQVVQNFLADPHLRWYLLGLAVLIVGSSLALYFALRTRPPEVLLLPSPTPAPTSTPAPPTSTPQPSPTSYMAYDLNIAISRLTVENAEPDSDLGIIIARVMQNQLDSQLQGLVDDGLMGKNYGIWGPEQIPAVTGDTPQDRADSAGKIAAAHAIHILIYGRVRVVSANEYTITPEFYVNDRELGDVNEMTGQNELGSAFPVHGDPLSTTFNARLNDSLSPRVTILTTVVRGLTFYVTHDYPKALSVLQPVAPLNPTPGPAPEGQELVYLLAGNAAGKDHQYDLAGQYYDLSYSVHSDTPYARALIGKAAILFMQSVKPWQSTKLEEIDYELLAQSTGLYEEATRALNKPPNGDVDARAAFGMGQNYFYRWYGQKEEFADPAVDNFNKMIQAYDAGDPAVKLRLHGLAAFSHGYLGLIYQLAGYPQEATSEFQQAVSMLEGEDLDADGQNKLSFYREQLKKADPHPVVP